MQQEDPISADRVLADVRAIGHSVRVVWFLLVGCAAFVGYGILNLVTPRTTRAWQVRATSRHGDRDARKVVGETFQGLLGDDPGSAPSSAVLRRVRVLGIVEIVCGLALASVIYVKA